MKRSKVVMDERKIYLNRDYSSRAKQLLKTGIDRNKEMNLNKSMIVENREFIIEIYILSLSLSLSLSRPSKLI